MRTRRQTKRNVKSPFLRHIILLPVLLLLLIAGGCGGDDSGFSPCPGPGPGPGPGPNPDPDPDPDPIPIMDVEIKGFKLTDWSGQQWQKHGGHPAGEIHPMLPLEFEVVMSSDRSYLSAEDQVWVAVYLMENPGIQATVHPFSTAENEPSDDPLYLGFHPFKLETGENTLVFQMYPEPGIRPGQYKGLKAEFFTPGLDAELSGKEQFEWLQSLTVLNINNLSPIDEAWSELTIQADPPMPDGAYGFDFGQNAIVDPISGFFRLFGADTPYSRGEQSGAVTGYYTELSVSLEILALSGTVGTIEFKEDNGLSFWNPNTSRFESTFLWEGQYASGVQFNPASGFYEAIYAKGFPRGTNGTTLVVGRSGSTLPNVKISDIKLTITAHNIGGSANAAGYIRALSDETLRPRKTETMSAFARGGDNDVPFYLPENPSRVDLPVTAENRKMDFSKNSFTWEEKLVDTDLWKRSMGPRVDYVGSGKRTLYGSEEGEKDKFAARAFAFFEEYTGLVHRLPAPGRMSIHDVSTICGTRTGTGVDIWIIDNRFTVFSAGAEFRNELTAKTASERNADGSYSLISDPAEVANYANFSGMESEFNAEVVVLDSTIIATPLYCNNSKPFDASLAKTRLFEKTQEVAVSAQIFIIEVRAGGRFTFYVDLRLQNQFESIAGGVKGTGSIALIPGIQVHGFAEAGVNLVLLSAHLGVQLLLIELAIVPEYVMEGQITWRNAANIPSVTAKWSSYPKLGLIIGTLDGEIYVKFKALFGLVNAKQVFFRWEGFRWILELWKGTPSDRPELTLPLRRYGETI